MNRIELRDKLDEMGVSRGRYSLNGDFIYEGYILGFDDFGEWFFMADYDPGRRPNRFYYYTESEACEHLLREIIQNWSFESQKLVQRTSDGGFQRLINTNQELFHFNSPNLNACFFKMNRKWLNGILNEIGISSEHYNLEDGIISEALTITRDVRGFKGRPPCSINSSLTVFNHCFQHEYSACRWLLSEMAYISYKTEMLRDPTFWGADTLELPIWWSSPLYVKMPG